MIAACYRNEKAKCLTLLTKQNRMESYGKVILLSKLHGCLFLKPANRISQTINRGNRPYFKILKLAIAKIYHRDILFLLFSRGSTLRRYENWLGCDFSRCYVIDHINKHICFVMAAIFSLSPKEKL